MALPRHSQNPPTKKRSPITIAAIFCLGLLVLVGLAILITWLAIKPKNLQYSIDEGWINHYNLTNNQLTSTFNFNLRTYNPNHKTSVYYDKMEVTVYYRGQNVAYNNKIAPFVQPRQNVTRVMFQIDAKNVNLPQGVVHDLKVERTGGEVDLDIKVKAKIRFKVGIFKTRHYKLKVLCSPVVVNFSDDKRFQTKDCDVDV